MQCVSIPLPVACVEEIPAICFDIRAEKKSQAKSREFTRASILSPGLTRACPRPDRMPRCVEIQPPLLT
jgi:hypothetical protein